MQRSSVDGCEEVSRKADGLCHKIEACRIEEMGTGIAKIWTANGDMFELSADGRRISRGNDRQNL
jgi:hypothetical protein